MSSGDQRDFGNEFWLDNLAKKVQNNPSAYRRNSQNNDLKYRGDMPKTLSEIYNSTPTTDDFNHISEANEYASNNGYKFFAWNEMIFNSETREYIGIKYTDFYES